MTMSTPELTDRSAFTLLEFLAVMAVIVVLLSLVMSAVPKLMGSARRNQAGAEMEDLARGFKAYRATCGQWPGQTQGSADSVYSNQLGHAALMAAFADRPDGRVFLEIAEATAAAGIWLDPWGRPYLIALDEDGDGAIRIPTEPPFTNINDTVAVLSLGPVPAKPGKWITTWSR
jgi:prepilin-type N-terminal cleavage/methylation domain-containing protein